MNPRFGQMYEELAHEITVQIEHSISSTKLVTSAHSVSYVIKSKNVPGD